MAGVSPDLLATCLEKVRSGRRTIEECLAAHPQEAQELRPLMEIALRIVPLPAVELDPAFRVRARVALVEAILAEKEATARFPWQRLGKLMAWPARPVVRSAPALATVVAVVLAASLALGGGATYAAQASLPGDALYPLKIAAERVQASLAVAEEAKAQIGVDCAARRLEEAQKAIQLERPDAAWRAAEDYARCLAEAERHLTKAVAEGKDADFVASQFSDRLTRQQAILAAVEEGTPERAKGALARASEEASRVLTTAKSFGRDAGPPAAPKQDDVKNGQARKGPDQGRDGAKGKEEPGVTAPSGVEPGLAQMISIVQGLAREPNVPGDSYKGLLAKLQAAQEALARGRLNAAVNNLDSFLNQLNGMLRSDHVSSQMYDDLYAKYAELVKKLGGVPKDKLAPAKRESKPEPTPQPKDQDRGKAAPREGPGEPKDEDRGKATPREDPGQPKDEDRGKAAPGDGPRESKNEDRGKAAPGDGPGKPKNEDRGKAAPGDGPGKPKNEDRGQPAPGQGPGRAESPDRPGAEERQGPDGGGPADTDRGKPGPEDGRNGGPTVGPGPRPEEGAHQGRGETGQAPSPPETDRPRQGPSSGSLPGQAPTTIAPGPERGEGTSGSRERSGKPAGQARAF